MLCYKISPIKHTPSIIRILRLTRPLKQKKLFSLRQLNKQSTFTSREYIIRKIFINNM